MDVNMPIMDGIEAIKTIRNELNLKDLIIISCTAFTEVDDICKCMQAGATTFLAKPITRDNCFNVLKEVLIK